MEKSLETKHKIISSFKQHVTFEAGDTFGCNFSIFHACPDFIRHYPETCAKIYLFKKCAKVLSSRFFLSQG